MNPFLILIIAYLVGSFPTALIVSRKVAGVDIREIGDGNMGARNVTRTLGWGAGIFVATVDFCKGGSAILLARSSNLSLSWQLAAGIFAVVGHDFPIWARFRGGQGMAAILGMLFFLMPVPTMWGLVVFLLAYLFSRSFDLSASIGLGCMAFLVWYSHIDRLLLDYTIVLFLSIPLKKIIDWPRRKQLRALAESRAKLAETFSNGQENSVESALSHR
jgi:glycerol-3-phosphate acyltransferase PlsY